MEMGVCIIGSGIALEILPGYPHPAILDRPADAVKGEVVCVEQVVCFGCMYWNLRGGNCGLALAQCCEHSLSIHLLFEPADSGRIVPGNTALARQLSRLPRSIHIHLPVA